MISPFYHEDASYVCISCDGSFLASRAWGEARLWSTTQGMLLATFESGWDCGMVFSRTNRLYYVVDPGSGRVYDASADPKSVTTKSFPLPSTIMSSSAVPHTRKFILPTPDESRILICTPSVLQVWSLQFTDTRDTPRYDIRGIDLSGDASLLALATETDIQIWDARFGQRLHVIQSRSRSKYSRPVAFSPKGELIVSVSDDGINVVDVRAGGLRLLPTAYSFPPQGWDATEMDIECVGISFHSSKLAAILWRCNRASGKEIRYLCVWDLPSGTLLHSLECSYIDVFQWSWTDQYLLFKPWRGNPRYLNAETFQEEILEHPGDRFHGPNHLHYYREGNMLGIQLPSGREGPLFSALSSHLNPRFFSSRGDRACIFSLDGQLLLLNTSGLAAYMEICDLQFEPEVSRIRLC